MAKDTMACELAGETLIVFYGRDNPSNDTFDRELTKAQGHLGRLGDRLQILVISDGGHPNALQRKRMLQALPNVRSAVVSSSRIARTVAFAAHLFNDRVKGFQYDDDAMDHLGLRGPEASMVIERAERLCLEYGARTAPYFRAATSDGAVE